MKPPGFQLQIILELNRHMRNSFADQGVISDENILTKLLHPA